MTTYADLERAIPFDVSQGEQGPDTGLASSVLHTLQVAGDALPPYWSFSRDRYLRHFYERSDPVKVSVNTFAAKCTSIPLRISPVDNNIKAHVQQAVDFQQALDVNSGMFRGWSHTLNQGAIDYLTQDNGCFFHIIGRGRITGPVMGMPLGIYTLDSARCRRTGDAEFPVIYQHLDGKLYKLHYTRVIYFANLPSAKAEMYGVGMSPTSCAIDASQELKDVSVYSQEQFGSRPMRRILYVKKGATLEQLLNAVAQAEQKMDAEGLSRFAKTLFLAPKNPTNDLELDTLSLTSQPENFNRMEVSLLDMAFLAAAFGLDLHDLAMSFGSRSTTSSAEVSERKGWGKGVAVFLQLFTSELKQKYLPESLQADFDNIDDEQDKAQAEIRNTRSQARERDMRSGVTTVRVERQKMLRHGEITQEEFEDMELVDGRLPNGLDLFSLFASTDSVIAPLVAFSAEDPTDINANDPMTMRTEIQAHIVEAWGRIDTAYTTRVQRRFRMALAALERLKAMYESALEAQMMMEQQALAADTADPTADPSARSDLAQETEMLSEDEQLPEDEPSPNGTVAKTWMGGS